MTRKLIIGAIVLVVGVVGGAVLTNAQQPAGPLDCTREFAGFGRFLLPPAGPDLDALTYPTLDEAAAAAREELVLVGRTDGGQVGELGGGADLPSETMAVVNDRGQAEVILYFAKVDRGYALTGLDFCEGAGPAGPFPTGVKR